MDFLDPRPSPVALGRARVGEPPFVMRKAKANLRLSASPQNSWALKRTPTQNSHTKEAQGLPLDCLPLLVCEEAILN